MKTTKLIRKSCFNPFYLPTANAYLENIFFYNSTGVILEVGRGWISSYGSNNTFEAIEIPEPVKRVPRPGSDPNFSRVECFFVPFKSDYKSEKRVILYIHTDLVNLHDAGTQKEAETPDTIYFYRLFSASVGCTEVVPVLNKQTGELDHRTEEKNEVVFRIYASKPNPNDTRSYYKRELDKVCLTDKYPATVKFHSEGGETKYMDINKESAAEIVAYLQAFINS